MKLEQDEYGAALWTGAAWATPRRACAAWPLDGIQHPALVANGDTDVMVPSINSVELARKLPHSELSIFPDAGHGAIFQYHSAFLEQTLRFLRN